MKKTFKDRIFQFSFRIQERLRRLFEKKQDDLNHVNDQDVVADEVVPDQENVPENMPHDSKESNQTTSSMDRWVKSEAMYQMRLAREKQKEQELTQSALDQSVVSPADGVTLTPFAKMLFGDETIKDSDQVSREHPDQVCDVKTDLEIMDEPDEKSQEPVSERNHNEKTDLEIVDEPDEEVQVSVPDQNFEPVEFEKKSDDNKIVDIPYEQIRTGLTDTQQTIVKAGINRKSADKNEQTIPETRIVLDTKPKNQLKDLIHQASLAHAHAMEQAKIRLETEPFEDQPVPKRKRRKNKPNRLVERHVSGDNNSMHVVETKNQSDQVIQDGKITRTIHIQQVKTDMVITETRPVTQNDLKETEKKTLPQQKTSAIKKRKTPKKVTTIKAVQKKAGGSKRGINMDRTRMLLMQYKEKGIAK